MDKHKQSELRNQVIWVDEAGLVGNATMNRLMKISKEQNARLILTGDINQHKPVERGDSLRIMQDIAKMDAVKVNKIQRQRNAKQYKQVVEELTKDKFEAAFKKLDEMGALHEHVSWKERNEKIAGEYLQSVKSKQEVLVVAPTHREGIQVTEAIREELKQAKILGKQNRIYDTQKNLNFTEAQKRNPKLYEEGMSIQFVQNMKGFKAGSKHDVIGRNDKGEILVRSTENRINILNVSKGKFNVYLKEEKAISIGEKIRITHNGKSIEGKKLNNGNMYQVVGFTKDGNIRLSNDSTISKDFRNLTYGYTMTSHSSQGKTVDKVIIAESGISFSAASKEQFYVSASRARKEISIYTDDKKELKQAVSKTGERLSATELMAKEKKSRTLDKMRQFGRKMMEKSNEIYRNVRGSERGKN